MNGMRSLKHFVMATGILFLMATEALAVTREPLVLPTVGDTIDAPYDAVWGASLKSLGVLQLPLVDKATGRIDTEPFTFVFGFGNDATQVIWVSLDVTVRPVDSQHTNIQVRPRVHHSLLLGVRPGPTNNPWLDFFARIRSRLGVS